MPRYFFDLTDGSREADLLGTELSSEREAEREAVRFLGEVLQHEPTRLSDDTLRVDVRDEAGGYRCAIAVRIEHRLA